MPSSGLFVTLYDTDTLQLYLEKGIYGFLMKPVQGEISPQSRHYHALGDYACARKGTHVFFFLKREIVYGGQVIGSSENGSFFINGTLSPLGKKISADLYWDESKRDKYKATETKGVFKVPDGRGNLRNKSQPYLLRFKDKINLKGRAISSDQLYFELGAYPYPLPSNSVQGMSFCTLTPCETDIALSLLKNDPVNSYIAESDEDISLEGEPPIFEPEYGVQNLKQAYEDDVFVNEAHIDASVISNPSLLPPSLQPQKESTICRQVPVCPYKPAQWDRADICYYHEESIEDGSLPNVIIEMKKGKAGKPAMRQIKRYLLWLYKVLEDRARDIKIYLLAPEFARTATLDFLPEKYRDQVELIAF